MKKKLVAWLILVLVVLQAFFVPVFAEGEETQFIQKSLSETNLGEDLLGDADATGADLEDLIGGSFSSGALYSEELDSFEVISAAYENDLFTYSFYLYVMNRGAVNFLYPQFYIQHGRACSVTLKAPDMPGPYNPISGPSYHPDIPDKIKYKTQSFNAQVVDVKGHFLKLRVDLRSTSDYLLKTSSQIIGIDIAEIGYSVFRSAPVIDKFEGGYVDSSLRIKFSSFTAPFPVRSEVTGRMLSHFATDFVASEPVLHLDVSLMSERYSSSSLESWYQLNSAAFLIPNKYVEKYGDYLYVHYKFGVYNDVPMIVYETSSDLSGFFSAPDATLIHIFETSGWLQLKELDYCPYFVYGVNSINHLSDGGEDVSSSVLLSSWADLKQNESPSDYQTVTRCSSYDFYDVWKGPNDSFSTVSFADAYGWWAWLFAGVMPWDNVVDDSIDVSATEVIDDPDDLGSLALSTDSSISTLYCVDECYSGDLRSLAQSALVNDCSVAILRYSMTDYHIYKDEIPNGYLDSSIHYCGDDAYLARNAIISDFQIIEIGLSQEPYDSSDVQSLILSGDIQVIDVQTDPQDYIGGLENNDHLKEGIIDRFDLYSWLKRLFAIFTVILVVVVIYFVLKFIGVFRFTFHRRRGDPPPKKKRRRLFGRRRE